MFKLSFLIAVLAFATATASAQSSNPETALEGLDPVMLVQGKEVQGDTNFKVTRGRFEYLFANAENKATLKKIRLATRSSWTARVRAWARRPRAIPISTRSTTAASTSSAPKNAKRFSKPLPRSIWKFPLQHQRPAPR